jgi:hypothetical protein
MKKSTLLSSALAAVFLLSTAMADDLHALAPVQTASTPNQDKKLSAIKEKTTCDPTIGNGFSLCAFLKSGISGKTASYSIESKQPVMGARFIQVIN